MDEGVIHNAAEAADVMYISHRPLAELLPEFDAYKIHTQK